MASIHTDNRTGRRAIRFQGKQVSLGKVTRRQAETARVYIETLIKCKDTGDVIPPATQSYVDECSPSMQRKLARAELIKIRPPKPTVAEWTEKYIVGRSGLKPLSIRGLRQVQQSVVAHMGKKRLDDVTQADAEAYRERLKAEGKATATIANAVKKAKQFFRRGGQSEDHPGESVRWRGDRQHGESQPVPLCGAGRYGRRPGPLPRRGVEADLRAVPVRRASLPVRSAPAEVGRHPLGEGLLSSCMRARQSITRTRAFGRCRSSQSFGRCCWMATTGRRMAANTSLGSTEMRQRICERRHTGSSNGPGSSLGSGRSRISARPGRRS